MANSSGEMPFLDHLEELRGRLIKALMAVVVGFCGAWWAVIYFHLIDRIKEPIAPYLPEGKLIVLTPTEPWMVTLKLGLVLGLVIASPVVIYQLWAFLSPALFPREKKAVMPALAIGLLLFLFGAFIGWHIAVPSMLKFFYNFQRNTFTWQITWSEYFNLIVQVLFYFGIGFELPLVMILLAVLGVMDYRKYVRLGRYAVFFCAVGGAFFSPTPDVLSMIIVMVLLLALYGVGVAGAFVVERRKRARDAALVTMIFLALSAAPRELRAQNPPPPAARQSGAAGLPGAGKLDSATAKRLGLPAHPQQAFPPADSLMQKLTQLKGFASTRYQGDSAMMDVDAQQVHLGGAPASTQREDGTLEAFDIIDDNRGCLVVAQGQPHFFQGATVLIGHQISYDTCHERAVIGEAYTSFNEPSMGGNWFVRGNLAVDSSAKRLFAAHSQFTSCDLPEPHYHFSTGELKWVSNSVIVARPAVLYIRDVPVVWLPFIFSDTKTGRRSGILIPKFGINDIVRPTPGYNRSVQNVGYYWAPNDYMDLTVAFDWTSNTSTQYTAALNYRWLDRFILPGSGLSFSEFRDYLGNTSETFHLDHHQSFNVTTKLDLSVNYSTNSTVLQTYAIDPTQSTATIHSSGTFSKLFPWGQLSIGGDRSQALGVGPGTMTLPTLTLSPKPFALGASSSWSPSLSIVNTTQFNTPPAAGDVLLSRNGVDSLTNAGHSRSTQFNLNTPFDIHGFTIAASVEAHDQQIVARQVTTTTVPDSASGNPADSLTRTTVRAGDYNSGINLDVGINLPSVLRNTWKLTPSVSSTNVTTGDLFIRSAGSNGAWVGQGKKLQLQLAAAPTFFGFLNMPIGPVVRTRYSVAPQMNLAWSPAASISPAFARALADNGTPVTSLTIPSTMTGSITIQQTIEAKVHPPAHDTTSDRSKWPNRRLLQISTSGFAYDFEQAKRPGQVGWTTPSITNSIQTDLLPNFTLSLGHDLWKGQVGSDTAKFSPFLTSVQANLSLTGRTFSSLAHALGLSHGTSGTGPVAAPSPAPGGLSAGSAFATGLTSIGGAPPPTTPGFSATVGYSLTRSRPNSVPLIVADTGFDPLPIQPPPTTGTQSDVNLMMSFSPTPFWSVTWSTEYDFTAGSFSSQNISLQRNLHDWRASFSFVKNANGNFALYFTVYLIAIPEIKADYRQQTVPTTPVIQP